MSTDKRQAPRPPEAKQVEISCQASDAKAVFVAGTFNDWKGDVLPLSRGGDGRWSVALTLPPGRYEYKFVVDGQWCCEPGCDKPAADCPDCVPNAFGTMNRLLAIS